MGNRNQKKYWVGFDLGGTKAVAAVFDSNLKLLGRRKKKTVVQEGPKAGILQIVELVNDAMDEAGITRSKVKGIGIGCPGMLLLDSGVVALSPNLGWKNLRVADLLRKRLGFPVSLLNDVDAGIYAEYLFGAAKGAHCAAGVFPGTGIGGGCIYDGSIVRGRYFSCFEIGHIQVQPDGPLCGCGRSGCLEAVASRLAVAGAAAQAARRGQAPWLLREAGTDLAKIRSRALADSIKAGDVAVEKIVREAARWLGVGISTLLNLLSCDVVVLGGGLVEAMPELFLEEVKDSVRTHGLPAFAAKCKIKISALGDNAVALGAAAWAGKNRNRGG